MNAIVELVNGRNPGWTHRLFRRSRASNAYSHKSGISLAEYGLIGVLGVCLCVGTLLTVGNQVDNLLNGLKQEMHNRVNSGKNIKNSLTTASAMASAVSKTVSDGMLQANPNNPDELCSQDGWCVKAPGLTGDAVYTTGSNGMQDLTETAADIYAQLADIAEKEGSDPELVALLTEMSLKGYAMAALQQQLAATGGMLQSGYLAQSIAGVMFNLQGQLGEFYAMSEQMNALTAKLPPDQRAILNDAARVIIATGNSYYLQPYDYTYGTFAVGFISSRVELTSTNSETICKNGGDSSKCGKKTDSEKDSR